PVEFTATPMTAADLAAGHLSMNYLLAPADGCVADVAFTFNNDKNVAITGTTYTNVPLKANYRTNIIGALLTNSTDFTVEIEAGFNKEEISVVTNAAALKDAIIKGGKIELANDITVDEWIMFSETKTISSGQIITVKMDGLTIDGKGHTLTVNDIESASNGDLLFDQASNLNIKNLTINYATGVAGGISLKSGVISKVNFVGGVYSIYPGAGGEILVEDCTFATNADALYFEQERDNLTINRCTFNQPAEKNVVLLRGDVKFTNNIVNSGRTVNVVSGSPVVTGNNFNDVRFKVYPAATATIANNTINNLVFETDYHSSTFTNNTLSAAAQKALNAVTVKTVSTYSEIVDAVKNGYKIEFASDITVDQWIMFSETKSISSGQIITVKMDGLTIDGKGHTLTVNDIESASNGDLLFDQASNLNIKNLTIKYANGVAGGISLKSGVISKVNFVGGNYGIYPGVGGEILVEDCTFATNADALYFEQERDNLTINRCTFNQPAEKNVVLLRGDVKFTNNIVNSGRTVNVVSGSPEVTGNNFNSVRLKVYSAATATIANNTINNLAFEDGKTTHSSTFTNNTLSAEAQAALNAMN
ncbi:MAG: right-handed parallel beta-helix repeat-containing protein, partial [Alistipes sp.]|nr:right-handed parallel beta-helix repeat-containing protein [Alistipes sp.]